LSQLFNVFVIISYVEYIFSNGLRLNKTYYSSMLIHL